MQHGQIAEQHAGDPVRIAARLLRQRDAGRRRDRAVDAG